MHTAPIVSTVDANVQPPPIRRRWRRGAKEAGKWKRPEEVEPRPR